MREAVVYLHVVGAFLFVLAHGASIIAAFRIRTERDRERIAALLELSSWGINLTYIGLTILILAGIAAGFIGNHWGRAWLWVSIGTLVVVMGAMYALATPYYGRMRVAAGASVPPQIAARLNPPPTEADLDAMAGSNRPLLLAAIGGIGLAVILWLMLFKPF